MTKEQAILKILKVLNSRMAAMSKPMRDEGQPKPQRPEKDYPDGYPS